MEVRIKMRFGLIWFDSLVLVGVGLSCLSQVGSVLDT